MHLLGIYEHKICFLRKLSGPFAMKFGREERLLIVLFCFIVKQ